MARLFYNMKTHDETNSDGAELDLFGFVTKTEKSDFAEIVFAHLAKLSGDALIDEINQIRTRIHDVSPFKNEPVDLVLWVKSESGLHFLPVSRPGP
jgi:hypothetical protein